LPSRAPVKIQMCVNRATRLVNAVSRWSTQSQRKSSTMKFRGRKYSPFPGDYRGKALHFINFNKGHFSLSLSLSLSLSRYRSRYSAMRCSLIKITKHQNLDDDFNDIYEILIDIRGYLCFLGYHFFAHKESVNSSDILITVLSIILSVENVLCQQNSLSISTGFVWNKKND